MDASEATLSTQPSLLLRIRDPQDSAAWQRFVEIYTPFIYNACKSKGLQAADAADVTQDVMHAVSQAIGRFQYDPARGAFRNWLFTVTRSRLNDFFRRRQRHPAGSGESQVQELLQSQPDPDAEEDLWQKAWKQHLLDYAAGIARAEFEPATWTAFWSTTIENRPVKEVAEELGLSTGAVYIARSRVLARLRKVVEEIDERAVE